MDGNGRWAQARGKPRAFGHRQGVEAVRGAVQAAGDLGVKWLTLFSFSTENWRRPADEVGYLFKLMREYVNADLHRFERQGVRIRVIGARDDLDADLLELIERAEARTAHNSAFNLVIAFNYGGRGEITRAALGLAQAIADGGLDPSDVDEERFAGFLDTHGMPDPDVLIRTSGEQRISNFLLWQCAYAELVFLDVLWPDFDRSAFEGALALYAQRERRFGDVTTSAEVGHVEP